jgi:cell wall-associated NlpC family hydrolase
MKILLALVAASILVACTAPVNSHAADRTYRRCQISYIGHGAHYWYVKYYRIKTGKIKANVNLQKHPALFRKYRCPGSLWKKHGPEYWHYKAAVLTAKARAKRRALVYESRPVRAVRVAMKFIGTWYVWGGTHYPPGFDCSGLVQYAYSQVGVYLPRTTYSQRYSGSHVYGSLKAGDILFFNYYEHEAMYIGNGLMIEAPHTGAQVRIRAVPSYVEARRVA